MNLEFWQKVKEEFEASYDNYICNGSDTFHFRWNDIDDKVEIQRLARCFLQDKGLISSNSMGIFLFATSDIGLYNRRSFRIEFINWVIKSLH
jgi:hypothetical protein